MEYFLNRLPRITSSRLLAPIERNAELIETPTVRCKFARSVHLSVEKTVTLINWRGRMGIKKRINLIQFMWHAWNQSVPIFWRVRYWALYIISKFSHQFTGSSKPSFVQYLQVWFFHCMEHGNSSWLGKCTMLISMVQNSWSKLQRGFYATESRNSARMKACCLPSAYSSLTLVLLKRYFAALSSRNLAQQNFPFSMIPGRSNALKWTLSVLLSRTKCVSLVCIKMFAISNVDTCLETKWAGHYHCTSKCTAH